MSLSLLKSSFFMRFRVWRNMFSVRSMCFLLRSFKKVQPEYKQIFRVSVVSSGRERFFNLFFSCAQLQFLYVCMLLPVCLHMHACARTHARAPAKIHNVGLFPSVFESIKKRLPATVLFTAVYKKSSKFPQKSIA